MRDFDIMLLFLLVFMYSKTSVIFSWISILSIKGGYPGTIESNKHQHWVNKAYIILPLLRHVTLIKADPYQSCNVGMLFFLSSFLSFTHLYPSTSRHTTLYEPTVCRPSMQYQSSRCEFLLSMW